MKPLVYILILLFFCGCGTKKNVNKIKSNKTENVDNLANTVKKDSLKLDKIIKKQSKTHTVSHQTDTISYFDILVEPKTDSAAFYVDINGYKIHSKNASVLLRRKNEKKTTTHQSNDTVSQSHQKNIGSGHYEQSVSNKSTQRTENQNTKQKDKSTKGGLGFVISAFIFILIIAALYFVYHKIKHKIL